MCTTRSWVRSRVVPPAPYVTDTYDGASGSSSCNVRSRIASASSVRGGKNSKDTDRPCVRMSLILAMRDDKRTRDSLVVARPIPTLRHSVHRRRRLRGRGYFSRLGPGLVTGAADDDPSG